MVTRESAIKTARAFVNECNSSGLTFYKVLLFGSAAKDKTHEWSDIDLLLISDQFSDNIFDNLKLYSKINIKYPVIETHPYSTKYYIEKDDFINEIIKESIVI
ncbi:MAG: nucleotidyltransferase domain-containing protein [Bacteroidales bacterium]|nr:nucleotidyltransferase domain-containing protein [Bacteroidales bacterium]MCF8389404.1 nucleotidyltransferase domain-containing protein [Bacteroidales bacterium]